MVLASRRYKCIFPRMQIFGNPSGFFNIICKCKNQGKHVPYCHILYVYQFLQLIDFNLPISMHMMYKCTNLFCTCPEYALHLSNSPNENIL